MAETLGGGTDGENLEAPLEERMGGVGDLDFGHRFVQWVLEEGIKLWDRLRIPRPLERSHEQLSPAHQLPAIQHLHHHLIENTLTNIT